MTKKKRLELIQEAKDMGLESVVIDGITYNLPATSQSVMVEDKDAHDLVSPMSALDDLSDEEIMYWSCPHFDTIQTNKKLREQQLKDENNG